MIYNKHQLCMVKNHAAHGEIAAVCSRCYDSALRWQAFQVREEQKAAHQKWLLLTNTLGDGVSGKRGFPEGLRRNRESGEEKLVAVSEI